MAEFEGTHGTSITRARVIHTNGFDVSVSGGRAGAGAYFWHLNNIAEKLARYWHKDSLSRGKYGGDTELGCAVIYATLKCHKDGYYDLESSSFKDRIMELYEEHHEGADLKPGDVTKIHETVISEAESELGTTAQVIRVRLAPPQSYPNFPFTLGAPVCYVVRQAGCITIDNVDGI